MMKTSYPVPAELAEAVRTYCETGGLKVAQFTGRILTEHLAGLDTQAEIVEKKKESKMSCHLAEKTVKNLAKFCKITGRRKEEIFLDALKSYLSLGEKNL